MEEAVYFGDSIQLTCHVSKGDKPIRLSWTFHGKELSSDLGIVTTRIGDDTSLLTVPSASTIHSGNYTCIAINLIGRTAYTAEILVNGISIMSFDLFLFFFFLFFWLPVYGGLFYD